MPPRTRRTTKSAAPEVVEDDAFEDLDPTDDGDDLEELEDAADTPAPPTKRRTAKKTAAPTAAKAEADTGPVYNTAWAAEYINDQVGTTLEPRTLRITLRKLANDDRLPRVVGEDRSRYVFPKGPNDPTIRMLVKMAKAGELTPAKREPKADTEPKPATRSRAKAAPEPVEDEAPVETTRTRTRRKGTATAAPAKAAPATRARTRRRAADDGE